MSKHTFHRGGSATGSLLIAVMSLLLFAGASRAGAQVDQHNDAFAPNLFNSIQLTGPIGQEFTPTLSSLQFVDLYTQDSDNTDPAGALLHVLIRQNSISGAILGISSDVPLPEGFNGVTHFSFFSPVSLLPGSTYVIQAEVVSGENWSLGRTDLSPIDTYPQGRPITFGAPETDGLADFWFREGISEVPELPASVPLGIAASALLISGGFMRKRRVQSPLNA